jgi:hypothetical protein
MLDLLDSKVSLDHLEVLVHKDQLETRDRRATRAQLDNREITVKPDLLAHKDRKESSGR